MRPAKTLLEHVRAGTFRPERHGKLLAGEELPVRPLRRGPSPAASRIWARMRELQHEYREVGPVEVRHDLARAFSQLANDYSSAAQTQRDPLEELDGLREIVTVNRCAVRIYEAEQEQGRELTSDERATVLREVRRELRPSRRAH